MTEQLIEDGFITFEDILLWGQVDDSDGGAARRLLADDLLKMFGNTLSPVSRVRRGVNKLDDDYNPAKERARLKRERR